MNLVASGIVHATDLEFARLYDKTRGRKIALEVNDAMPVCLIACGGYHGREAHTLP